MTAEQAEEYFRKYLGATNFIWLKGVTDKDITDAHINGTARFYDDKTLLTVPKEEFLELYEGILESDYEKLISARNTKEEPYKIVELTMTSENVEGLVYKGSYLNYYIGNEVILLPFYNDVKDEVAISILSELYEDRKIIPINVTGLYQYGGMLHCVTQQQTLNKNK
ncbi:agmatine deiminase [Clostridium botulinum]|nr:porphyromonas-type peptidyl-arginine deiminase family protein [Clostridium botulinum]MBN3363072.1 agmatine deiminase [Clostridium botulinum]